MYFNPALEIYVFDNEATINDLTGTIDHEYKVFGMIIAKIEGDLCSNLEISCERSPHDENDNYTMEKRKAYNYNRFRFDNSDRVSADEIYHAFFGYDHRFVHQYQNKHILYKRVNSVLQIYISIKHFSQWDECTIVSLNPVSSMHAGRKCTLEISNAIKFHLGEILSTYTYHDMIKMNREKTDKYSIDNTNEIIQRARKHMKDFMPVLHEPETKTIPHCDNLSKRVPTTGAQDTDYKILCPILLDHIKELSNGNHNQIIKHILSCDTITDSGKMNAIKYLLD